MVTQGAFDSTFQFLFEPVKDLTENFNIDLNHHLDEYLNQLEGNDLLVRNGSRAINFVEAAFILRGSAAVYAKKVDYLYDLTLKILESLTGSQEKKKLSNVSRDIVDRDVSHSISEMSALDDIEVSKNLVCMEEIDEMSSLSISMPMSLQKQKMSIGQKSAINISESESDKRNFSINTCKIINSTLILNYSEMKSLLAFVNCNNRDEQVNHDGKIGHFGDVDVNPMNAEADSLAELTNASLGEFPNLENIMEQDRPIVDRKNNNGVDRGTCLKQETAKRPEKANLCLLDPYEVRDARFVKKERIGRTFSVPASLLKKDDVARNHSLPVKRFLEKRRSDCAVRKLLKGATIEREFQDLFLVKHKRTKTKTSNLPIGSNRKCTNEHTAAHTSNDAEAVEEEEEEDEDRLMLNDENFDLPDILHEMCQMDDILPYVAPSYEDAVQLHLARFFDVAERYKVTSDLAQRVAEWESKIAPALEAESKARVYDIKEYSEEVIQLLEGCGGSERPVQFPRLVADRSRSDVCRLFMASLHLINHNNVRISSHQEPNSFCLEILSKDLHHKAFL